jgi:hypothetical protein
MRPSILGVALGRDLAEVCGGGGEEVKDGDGVRGAKVPDGEI